MGDKTIQGNKTIITAVILCACFTALWVTGYAVMANFNLGNVIDEKFLNTFKMLYTDDQTYVDGLLKDGTMVRVMIKADPEGWRYVPTDEGDIEVWQSFDDMFFAG